MKRCALFLSVLLVVLVSWSTSSAAVGKWSVELGAEGAFINPSAGLDLKQYNSHGLRAGLVLHPAFEVMATYDTTSPNSKVLPNSDLTQDFMGLRVVGVFHAAEDTRVNPYMIAGGGILKTTFKSGVAGDPTIDDKAFYEDVGAGLRFHVVKGLYANGEYFVRHYRTLEKTSSNSWYSFGFSWFLGGKQ